MTFYADTDQIRAFATRLTDLASQIGGDSHDALSYRQGYVAPGDVVDAPLGRVQSYITALAPQIDTNLNAIRSVLLQSASAVSQVAQSYDEMDAQQAAALDQLYPV